MSGVIQAVTSCVVPNTGLPISVEYARTHLRGIVGLEDNLIEGWIRAAGQMFEEHTGRPLLTATFETWLDGFPAQTKIELPRAPLVEVESVTYVSADGTVLSVTDGASPETDLWQSRTPEGVYAPPGWVELISGNVWPVARSEAGAVRVRYTAGYGETEDEVPAAVKAVLLLLVGMFDQFRSQMHEGNVDQLPYGVDQMLFAFKWSAVPTTVPTWL